MIEGNIHTMTCNILREDLLEKMSFKGGAGESIKDMEKISYKICRIQSKVKIWSPFSESIKILKMVTTDF